MKTKILAGFHIYIRVPLKSSAYEKCEYGHLGRSYIKLTLGGSKTETNFQKKKKSIGKTPLFVIGPFCSRHSICLNIGL